MALIWLRGLMAGILIGTVAWPHAPALAVLLILLLPVFRSRYLAALGYYLSASVGLLSGTATFFPHTGLALGMAFWVTSAAVLALPYLVYDGLIRRFPAHIGPHLAGLVTVTAISILPPLGVIGWTNPWVGSIEAGPAGPVLVIGAFIVIVSLRIFGSHTWAPRVVAGVVTGFIAICQVPLPVPLVGWVAIDTHHGLLKGPMSPISLSFHLRAVVLKKLSDLHTHVVILPESIVGYWLPGTAAVWQPVIQWTATHSRQTVLLGALVPEGRGYADALLKIHDGHIRILTDRIPVPFSMWHPWDPIESARMTVFGRREAVHVDGQKVGYLICYEQLLTLPELSLTFSPPEVLIGAANDWWAKGTNIPEIQRASLRAWARLWDVPVIDAVNYGYTTTVPAIPHQ
ncbi:MAG: carbon-nitrogen hydrolase family protein [Acidithiobacillus ferrooxidans]